MNKDRIKQFILPKLKFASTSGVSTILDYVIVFLLLDMFDFRNEGAFLGIKLTYANTIGTAIGMISNFILQKKFVFQSRRRLGWLIVMTFSFSVFSFFLNQFLFDILRRFISFLSQHTFITKIIVTGIMFFFNFYTKRFSFEKRVLSTQE